MIVTHVLGDCPECGANNRFGNVSVGGQYVVQGCTACQFRRQIPLPAIRKRILYLDQCIFSSAFRGNEQRFIDAANRIREVAVKQLLVSPYSSIHTDEANQWRGFAGMDREGLLSFIKSVSGGHKFEPAYDIEHNQINRAFRAFLAGEQNGYELEERHIFQDSVHQWDDYFYIGLKGGYIGDTELVRRLKNQSVEGLVDTFDSWRDSELTFDQHIEIEFADAAKGYIDAYLDYMARMISNDHAAFLNAPINSAVVEQMLHLLPEESPFDEKLRDIARYFRSDYFKTLPYQALSARIFSTLRELVRGGAYANRDRSIQRLSGFFYDVSHVATYAPYCDAIVLDQPMAELVNHPRVGLTRDYGTRVFSLNNWDEFFAWIDEIENEITPEHEQALEVAYPG